MHRQGLNLHFSQIHSQGAKPQSSHQQVGHLHHLPQSGAPQVLPVSSQSGQGLGFIYLPSLCVLIALPLCGIGARVWLVALTIVAHKLSFLWHLTGMVTTPRKTPTPFAVVSMSNHLPPPIRALTLCEFLGRARHLLIRQRLAFTPDVSAFTTEKLAKGSREGIWVRHGRPQQVA